MKNVARKNDASCELSMAQSDLSSMYNEAFYDFQMNESYGAAKIYAKILLEIYKPNSVVDLGCGRGTWLKAFKVAGVSEVVGFDGAWNSQQNMVDSAIVFHEADLNQPIVLNKKFDLAMSLEVAEHLQISQSHSFIDSLTRLSDTILFGAAYTNQGGTNHINEQPHTYWASIFMSFGYVPFDLFRPIVWGNDEVPFWYQQNAFLYVKKNSAQFDFLLSKNIFPIVNLEFMNCIHPVLFGIRSDVKSIIKSMVVKVVPLAFLPIVFKIKRFFVKNK